MKNLKIKKSILTVASLVALSFITGCQRDFLSLSPEDQVSGANFFKTEADFTQALNAAYNPLRVVGPDYFTGEMRTDNTHYQYTPGNQGTAIVMGQDIADFTNNASDNYSNDIYYNCYRGISRSNIILSKLGEASISDASKQNFEGQAKFLRAFYYFKLVRYFGGTPLYLTPVTSENDAFLPRSTAEDIYRQIIADTTDAIAMLTKPTKFPQSGYATKGAATMLLADVYATKKEYAKAEELLLSLEPMGYTLLPNYKDVFSTANKNSKESIFEVQFMQGLENSMQSNFAYVFLPRTTNTSMITYGVATNNTGTGGWNTPTWDLINSYEAGDTRLEASIGIAEGTYDASNYFKITADKSPRNYTAPSGKTGVPYIKKYLNPHVSPGNTDDNWYVYRFADALLLLSEVQNEQGKTALALQNLNRVRKRAIPSAAPITTTNKAELKALILQERRVELAFENKRLFDLIRSGKAVEILNAYGVKIKAKNTYLPATSYQVNENKLLYPIPFAEIGVNPKLTQNPGY